jgi:hypothetical protein
MGVMRNTSTLLEKSRVLTIRQRLLFLPLLTLIGLVALQAINSLFAAEINDRVIAPNAAAVMIEGHKNYLNALAAGETTAKIEAVIARAAGAVTAGAKVDVALSDIGGRLAEMVALSANTTAAIDQIAIAVLQMNGVTQNTAANAEESAATAEELNVQSVAMQEAVADMSALVGAAQGGGRRGVASGTRHV